MYKLAACHFFGGLCTLVRSGVPPFAKLLDQLFRPCIGLVQVGLGLCAICTEWIALGSRAWRVSCRTLADYCTCKLKVNSNVVLANKKAVLSQRWPRNAPYIWAPWKFSGLPDYDHGHCSQHFHGLLFRSTLWMFLQNLKSVALPVPGIIGGKNLGSPSPKFPHVPLGVGDSHFGYKEQRCWANCVCN